MIDADALILAQQRHAQERFVSRCDGRSSCDPGNGSPSPDVKIMHVRPACSRRPHVRRSSARLIAILSHTTADDPDAAPPEDESLPSFNADRASSASRSSQALSTIALRAGLHVGRGRRDHLEDFAASGLIRQRLGEFAGLGLNLIEQPRILDGDHGLVGEGLAPVPSVFGESLKPASGCVRLIVPMPTPSRSKGTKVMEPKSPALRRATSCSRACLEPTRPGFQ